MVIRFFLKDQHLLLFGKYIFLLFRKNMDFFGINSEKIIIFSEFDAFCVYLQRINTNRYDCT